MKKLSQAGLLLAVCALSGCATSTARDVQTAGASMPNNESVRDETSTSFAEGHHPLLVELARFEAETPAGVAVSSDGRVFIAFPWLDRQPAAAVGELLAGGEVTPYPNLTWNQWDGDPGPSALRAIVSAQALTITRESHGEFLWVLDSGNPRQRGVVLGGPKLFKIDLADDNVAQVIYLDHERDLAPHSQLSDLRVDPATHTAYLSDTHRGALVVVDLKQRRTRTVLLGHDSTRAEPGVVLHTALKAPDSRGRLDTPPGVAGVELSADGAWLYYHALAGRTLYRACTAVLRDAKLGPEAVAAAVENLGATGSVIDGMTLNRETGELYLTALEANAIFVRRNTGRIEPLVSDARLRWPDSVALASDGYLFVTASSKQFKRPFLSRPSGDVASFVFKVSLDYLRTAALAERESEMARRAAEESRQLAAAARERVVSARRAAETEAGAVAQALREVSAATERVNLQRFDLARAEQSVIDRRAQQRDAMRISEHDAEAAEVRVQVAALAEAEAKEAARIAALKAAEAASAAAAARSAKRTADESRARVQAAAEAHGRALLAVENARRDADEAHDIVAQLQRSAEARQARAQIAAKSWVAENRDAQEFIAAAERAERLAATAARSLETARLAEAGMDTANPVPADETGPSVELADVPTGQ